MPTPNLGVLGQPMVQDMAMQYGQQVFIDSSYFYMSHVFVTNVCSIV